MAVFVENHKIAQTPWAGLPCLVRVEPPSAPFLRPGGTSAFMAKTLRSQLSLHSLQYAERARPGADSLWDQPTHSWQGVPRTTQSSGLMEHLTRWSCEL